ncbi:MAG: hypothetical protein JSW51_05375 [Gemmatimonadota bacterium]|nr:MAG: hypothetical protein JSW51_05375 [Gemmatimonadota bacterium]
MEPQSFADLERVAEKYGELNDCTVKAIAAACGVSYGKAHRTLTKLGRLRRRGATVTQINAALDAIMGTDTNVIESYRGSSIGLTLNRFRKAHPTGSYIICSRGHAMAVVEGELIDWTADTAGRRKVTNVWRIK